MSQDLERVLQQNNELMAQLAKFMAQRSSEKGGTEEMPRKLKYGQGSITKRFRLSYVDERGIRRMKNTTDEVVAEQISSKYKCKIYEWYQVRWYDEHGLRHSRTLKNKQEARDIITKLGKRKKNVGKKRTKTFGVYLQEWYDTFKKPVISKGRAASYDTYLKQIPKSITSKPFHQITVTDLQGYLNSITKKPQAKYETKNLFGACLKHAYKIGHTKSNNGELLYCERPVAAERQTLKKEDENKFVSLITSTYRNHVICYLYTGCRLAELLRIHEEDVDRVNKTIKIKGANKGKKANGVYRERIIPLMPEIEHIKFPLPKICVTGMQKRMRLACEDLGVRVTIHDLRHTFATRCNERGINTKALQGILGHTNYSMTYDRYVKNTDKLMETEFEKLRKNTPISTPISDEKRYKNKGKTKKIRK